jgi:hypothetical protein
MGFSMFFCWDIMGCISWGMVIPAFVVNDGDIGIPQITRSQATAGAFTSGTQAWLTGKSRKDLEVLMIWNGNFI